jgi:SAM-dependent methyltransferase
MKNTLLDFIRNHSSVETRRQIVKYTRWPPVRFINFGSFSRLKPISRFWGTDRGTPIDRYYIEKFLENNASFIKGVVLEIGDNTYTLKYGKSKVEQSDVLHVAENKPNVTIIGDLTDAGHIPSDLFDCIIITQTLQYIFNLQEVIKTIYRILKPGGSVLVTVPGISQICRYDMDRWGEYWRFTSKSIKKIFEACFDSRTISIYTYGNVKASIAFLHGISYEEMKVSDLEFHDPDYELNIALVATKTI